jgi:hypothetical protein
VERAKTAAPAKASADFRTANLLCFVTRNNRGEGKGFPLRQWVLLPISLSWRVPVREPEEKKLPIGVPLPDITMDQFMDIEDGWSAREERV